MAPRLSDLIREGALNDIVALLNRSADADSLALALDRLRRLLGSAGARPPEKPALPPGGAGAASVGELLHLVHLALGRPDHKLAAYGTLVPGGVNHGRVAALRGSWQRCHVRGRRWTAADGDPAFRWNPAEPEVEAMLLVSDQLPSAWPALDRFEGSAYRRHLVPVRGEEAHQVAYLYESLDQAVSE